MTRAFLIQGVIPFHNAIVVFADGSAIPGDIMAPMMGSIPSQRGPVQMSLVLRKRLARMKTKRGRKVRVSSKRMLLFSGSPSVPGLSAGPGNPFARAMATAAINPVGVSKMRTAPIRSSKSKSKDPPARRVLWKKMKPTHGWRSR